MRSRGPGPARARGRNPRRTVLWPRRSPDRSHRRVRFPASTALPPGGPPFRPAARPPGGPLPVHPLHPHPFLRRTRAGLGRPARSHPHRPRAPRSVSGADHAAPPGPHRRGGRPDPGSPPGLRRWDPLLPRAPAGVSIRL